MKHNTYPLSEKIFFFPGSGNRNLLGFLHYADSPKSSTGIVYCHPFAEEKNMSHSVMVKAARKFATAGIPVLRFDFSGCGDSEGDLHFFVVEDWLQDLDSAIDALRKETGISKCLLWGLRLGAGFSLMRQQYGSDIAGLILWQPVLDFSIYIKQFLRQAISLQISKGREGNAGLNTQDDLEGHGLVHVIGYPITKDLYDSFNSIGNQPSNIVPSVPVFILSISLMEQPAFTMKKYAEFLKKAGTQVMLKHINSEVFWNRYWQWECQKAAETTLQWLHGLV